MIPVKVKYLAMCHLVSVWIKQIKKLLVGDNCHMSHFSPIELVSTRCRHVSFLYSRVLHFYYGTTVVVHIVRETLYTGRIILQASIHSVSFLVLERDPKPTSVGFLFVRIFCFSHERRGEERRGASKRIWHMNIMA